MYEPHLDFDAPPLDTPIWRYLKLWKFESLIQTGTLFFASALQMEDRFEGSYPRRSGDFSNRQDLSAERQESASNSFRDLRRHSRDFLKIVYLNCWHINASESDAMWKLYVPNHDGVAIRSTFRRLRDSFASDRRAIQIGKIAYIDFERDTINAPYGFTVFMPFLRKRLEFQHEQELRAIILEPQSEDSESIVTVAHIADVSPLRGVTVACELKTLVEEIVLAPSAPSSLVVSVSQLLSLSKLSAPIRKSALEAEPW